MAKMRRAVDKREDDIKKKLTAAIMMLLVSCIMVVTSTYAWFTLSTAPEVTGIQTTIGGNGNLEIALANDSTWGTGEPETLQGYDDKTPMTTINESWGNLITLDNANYGINLLNLSPAALALPEGTKKVSNQVLILPKYGPDGRISTMMDAISGTYVDGAFGRNDGNGLRAFGLSVKMTERQSAFNKYLNLASSTSNSAVTTISTSLGANGGVLANTAFNLAMSSGNRDSLEFDKDQLASIKNLVNATVTSLTKVDESIIATINAYLASGLSSMDDAQYNNIKGVIEGLNVKSNITVSGNVVTIKNAEGTELTTINHEQLASTITKFNTASTQAAAAKTAADAITTTTTTWGAIKGIVGHLMNIDGIMTSEGQESNIILINDMNVKQLKEYVGYTGSGSELNFDNAMKLLDGMTIKLNDESGLFYDIAELAGNLVSNFESKVTYSGMTLTIDASIVAYPTNPSPILPAVYKLVEKEVPTSAGSAEANVISDVYGYAVDLLFRTNADKSDLLLQTLPTDRIYDENNNPETQGAGSYFEFTKYTTTFSDADMLRLMNAIRIVITDGENNILGEARLDTRAGKYVANGTTIYVPIRLVDTTKQSTDAGYFIEDGSTIDADTGKAVANQQAITALTKNKKTAVSFIVYLDGDKVTNADVANASKSMTGTMNLQFASNAGLQAMDYSGLKVNGDDTTNGTDTPVNP